MFANISGTTHTGALIADVWGGTKTANSCIAIATFSTKRTFVGSGHYSLVAADNIEALEDAEQMKGIAAKNYMPALNWGVDWFTTEDYPTPFACDHIYDNACDVSCNLCGTIRDVKNHIFDNDSDAYCNVCGFFRFELSGTSGDCQWEIENGVLRIYGNGAMGDFVLNDMPRSDWALYGITSVVIEEGVTYIGNAAFAGCKRLVSVSIPSTVTSIGAFHSLTVLHLKKLQLRQGIQFINRKTTALLKPPIKK